MSFVMAMSLNILFVMQKWQKCPGMSWIILEFEFEICVITMPMSYLFES